MAELIKDTGEVSMVAPANGKKFTLKELQGFVEGFIELVTLHDGRLMFLNEEGKYDPKIKHRLNMAASVYLQMAGGIPGDFVTGNVLICSKREA